MAGGRLYLVGTPIGNLEDVTLRALRVLKEADLIAAEDTRRARKLLSRYDIHTPLTSYHRHNEREMAERIAAEVSSGKKVALISDAGMPGVSDPGFRVVDECSRLGLDMEVVPGPSALTASLSLSGLPLASFRYEGFPPRKRAERRTRLMHLLREGEALVFYEAPHRLLETLRDLGELAPERLLVVARELTKVHEEVLRGSPEDMLRCFEGEGPRGEFVLIVSPSGEEEAPPLPGLAAEVGLLCEEGLPTREAVKAVAKRWGVSQREVYSTWLKEKERERD
ncbi:MAG: 16S rRNA (cytidine(1402)-2'-O)-methyltransferase [Actinomycetota bacterium]|nr:16S rRNA (cytidine(1402)-2'-O)-methyltransferase [Actinomycetota bacterium]